MQESSFLSHMRKSTVLVPNQGTVSTRAVIRLKHESMKSIASIKQMNNNKKPHHITQDKEQTLTFSYDHDRHVPCETCLDQAQKPRIRVEN